MYQDVEKVEPVGECVQQLPFPDHSKAKPDKTIREYRVEMHIDYEGGDPPILFSVSSADPGNVPINRPRKDAPSSRVVKLTTRLDAG